MVLAWDLLRAQSQFLTSAMVMPGLPQILILASVLWRMQLKSPAAAHMLQGALSHSLVSVPAVQITVQYQYLVAD